MEAAYIIPKQAQFLDYASYSRLCVHHDILKLSQFWTMSWRSSILPRTSRNWLSFCCDFRQWPTFYANYHCWGWREKIIQLELNPTVMSHLAGWCLEGYGLCTAKSWALQNYLTITVFNSFHWPNLLGWLLQCDDVRLPRTVGQADRPRGAHVPAPARPEHLLQRGEAFLWLSLSFSLAFCCFPLVFLIFSSFPLGFLLTFLVLSYGFSCDSPLAFLFLSFGSPRAHLWLSSASSFFRAFLCLFSCIFFSGVFVWGFYLLDFILWI